MKPAVLLIDLETFPMRGYFWELYETNPLWVDQPTIICCVSMKWLGGKQMTKALPDYKGYRPGARKDKKLVKEIWQYLDKADIVIGQNSISFDLKIINTAFVKHKMTPPSPYKTIDTLRTARKVFRFPSNRLDSLGDQMNEGRKMEHEGHALWKKCIDGDMKAWAKMKRYNAQDVRLLERVYERFVPWMINPPNRGMWDNGVCPKCGSNDLTRRGIARNTQGYYQKLQCRNCGSWSQSKARYKKIETLKSL